MTELILASESPYRRILLDRLHVPYRATAHKCNERTIPAAASFRAHALDIAIAKATSLSEEFPCAHILASDQIAEFRGEVLHKPGLRSGALEQLSRLSGASHRLITAVALRSPSGNLSTATDIHHMHMRKLSLQEIERYLDQDNPVDCCGGYKIESLGISLFERIEGADFTAISGMPMMAVAALLREANFDVP